MATTCAVKRNVPFPLIPLHLHVCRMMSVPATVIYFTCYDQLRDCLQYSLGLQGNHIPLISGGLARCKSTPPCGPPVSLATYRGCVFAVGAVTVISPLELVRTKMQSRRRPYGELFACIRSAVSQDGVLSLWRGWGPTVLRDVPFSGRAAPQVPDVREAQQECVGDVCGCVCFQLCTGLTMNW